MILRIVRGRVRATDRDRMVEYIREDALRPTVRIPGMTSFQPAIREGGEELELVVVSTWTDFDAVLATGAVRESPVALPRMKDILIEPRTEHYELMIRAASSLPADDAILRLSTVELRPTVSALFYERVRGLWDGLVDGSGLIGLFLGRRVRGRDETAVIASVWDGPESLAAATADGFVGGVGMGEFYASEPNIEHYDALRVVQPLDESVPLILADDDRRLVHLTPATARLLRRSMARLSSMRLEDLVTGSTRAAVTALWAGLASTGTMTGTLGLVLGDGSDREVRYAARGHTPWPGTHAAVFAPAGSDEPLDVDAALAGSGLLPRGLP